MSLFYVIAYRDSSPVASSDDEQHKPMRAYSRSLNGDAIP